MGKKMLRATRARGKSGPPLGEKKDVLTFLHKKMMLTNLASLKVDLVSLFVCVAPHSPAQNNSVMRSADGK